MKVGTVKIPLSRGIFALIDESDLPLIEKHKWHVNKSPYNIHAATNIKQENKQWKLFKMHRFILNAPKEMQVDHINHDGLDNRRENLRLCTPSQNSANRRARKNGTSKFRGVSWHKVDRKWMVALAKEGRIEYVGRFENEIEAAKAYNTKAIELHGAFAHLNIIETHPL